MKRNSAAAQQRARSARAERRRGEGRNAPCACGSGKKSKRCCRDRANPVLTTASWGEASSDQEALEVTARRATDEEVAVFAQGGEPAVFVVVEAVPGSGVWVEEVTSRIETGDQGSSGGPLVDVGSRADSGGVESGLPVFVEHEPASHLFEVGDLFMTLVTPGEDLRIWICEDCPECRKKIARGRRALARKRAGRASSRSVVN